MRQQHTRALLSILLLLGAFTVAFNLAVAFPELGHTTAVLIDGGQIQEFVLNPFSWSWNLGQGVRNIEFTAWGGVTIGLFYTILPLFFIRLVKSNELKLVFKLLAGCGFLINGIYLLIGVLFSVGDGAELRSLGVSLVLLLVIGTIYVLFALIIWSEAQRHLGFAQPVSLPRRLLVMITGVSPYMAAIIVYNYLFNPEQLLLWSGFALTGVAVAVFFSMTGHLWDRYAGRAAQQVEVSKLSCFAILFIGAFVILAEFLIFGTHHHPF